jgi:hypothetical protein
MPSPFPGMDPSIERYRFHDFHTSMLVTVRDLLVPHVRPKYVVLTQERLFVDREEGNGVRRYIEPDVVVGEPYSLARRAGSAAVATMAEPVPIMLPLIEPRKERYLTIHERETMDLVTVIEVLSPSNKREGEGNRTLYLSKRLEVTQSRTHLVEIDLLRGGKRLPTAEPLPPGDFFAIVSRAGMRPCADAYPWTLRQTMPVIPIPLSEGDADVPLDLQAAFTTAYDRAGYDYSLDYEADPEPALSVEDAAWAKDLLASRPPVTA